MKFVRTLGWFPGTNWRQRPSDLNPIEYVRDMLQNSENSIRRQPQTELSNSAGMCHDRKTPDKTYRFPSTSYSCRYSGDDRSYA